MRTTVNLDDGLLATVKGLAQDRGQTLGDVLEAALQHYLGTAAAQRNVPVELPVFQGRLGVRPGVDLRTNAGLSEAMNAEEDAKMARRIRDERS